jgi:hypothetical protein
MQARKTALLFIAAAFATAAAGQVANGDFDAGADHWGISLDAGAGGILDWDSTTGDPAPGSARAGNVFVGTQVDGWGQCVPFSGGDYAFSAAVASALQAGNSCRIRIDFIANADCIDATPIVLEVVQANARNDGTFETLAAGGTLPAGVLAAAVSLEHVRVKDAHAGSSFCHFDHVGLAADTIFIATLD